MEVALVCNVGKEVREKRREGTVWRRWFTAVGKTIRVVEESSVYFKNISEHRGTLEISTDVTAILLEIYT